MFNILKLSLKSTPPSDNKYLAEAKFWQQEIEYYIDWYRGNRKLYGIEPPSNDQKINKFSDIKKNAAATWSLIYQQPRYLDDLQLSAEALRNLRILDIGCGPVTSALAFTGCEIYGLDHLVDLYRQIGFPIDEYNRERYHFIQAKSENIPFEDNFFDAVISANAIDHVDDINQTAQEIIRVLRKDGIFRMHVHYHPATVTEPLCFDDQIFYDLFKQITGLHKISNRRVKDLGFTSAPENEEYVIWGNGQ